MPEFPSSNPGEIADRVIRVREAYTESSIPWEHPRHYADRPLARTAFDRDAHALLGYLLAPWQTPAINAAWLSSIGAERLGNENSSLIYRFTLPTLPEMTAMFDDEPVYCYLELAADFTPQNEMQGWFGLFRTVSEGREQSQRPALIACKKFVYQAELVMLLLVLGCWPYTQPENVSA